MTPPQPNPALPSESSAALDRALQLVRFLRANCEWDAAQTPESLIRYLLEEASETADAIRAGDDMHVAAELGDLLLNVAFQIVIAEERGAFTADDVVRRLESKMRRRHPHLYGDGPRTSWDEVKRSESERAGGGPAPERGFAGTSQPPGDEAREGHVDGTASVLDDVAAALPPLTRAHAIQARVAELGFDWPDASGALAKVREEAAEVGELLAAAERVGDRIEDEIGDLFFAAVNLARLTGIDSSVALRRANAKFSGRFRELEREARLRGVVLGEASLDELDRIWNDVKRRS